MITIEQALPILQHTINKDIRHQDYKRVTELATLYRQLITGEDANKLLRQYVPNEEAHMFKQRELLTVAITPAVSETLMNPFYRVGRLDNAKRIISYPDAEVKADTKIAEINDRINSFWGQEALDKYLATRNTQLAFLDPNAWVAVEFDGFNPNREKAKPYPKEFTSEQAINFSIRNNETEWVIFRNPISQNIDGATYDGYQYIMYLPNEHIQFSEILGPQQQTNQLSGASMVNGETWQSDGQKRYNVMFFHPKGGEVQAFRTGYKLDLQTNGRTFVNPFHAALPYFMKTIKTVSEMDLTMTIHAFKQKIIRANPCPGTEHEPCNNGETLNGGLCTVCKGTGSKSVHTTTQDVIEVPFPTNKDQNPVKLDDIVYYVPLQVELLEFQKKYIDDLEAKAIRTVFNSEILTKTTVAQTATERITSKDEMYNTLHPFAEYFSTCWKKTVRLIAAFTDNLPGLTLIHEFPSDFKLKTVTELLEDLKQAHDSDAPAFVIQEISKDIAAKMYADDETAFMKFIVKSRFTPFLGKTSEDIKFILDTGRARIEDQILWTHSDTIFDDLENEVPGFFMFTYEKQWSHILKKIATITASLPKDTVALDFRDVVPGSESDTPVDVELEAKARLKGSVGGTQGILAIQTSVAQGVTQYEAAVALLYEIYGFEDATARKLLGSPKALEAANAPVTA